MSMSMPRIIKEVCQDFFELIFPAVCVACEHPLIRGEGQVCTKCKASLSKTNFHLLEESPLEKLFWGRIPIQHIWAYLSYHKGGKTQKLLHSLKYRNNQLLGVELGQWYGYDLLAANLAQHFDYIIPVPLHASRLRSRGYNQSELFAQGLSAIMGVPCISTAVVRSTATSTQTKKARYARWLNVEAVFEAKDTAAIKGKHLLLVDDVVTTGATLEALGQVFLEAGCKGISIVTIAYAK